MLTLNAGYFPARTQSCLHHHTCSQWSTQHASVIHHVVSIDCTKCSSETRNQAQRQTSMLAKPRLRPQPANKTTRSKQSTHAGPIRHALGSLCQNSWTSIGTSTLLQQSGSEANQCAGKAMHMEEAAACRRTKRWKANQRC